MKRTIASLTGCALLLLLLSVGATKASAAPDPLSGAIFTTLIDGQEVNFNIYPSKDAVYLNGGPGIHAPTGAAGLPDGTYVFQVTNPNGDTLLSTDLPRCRQVVVIGGVFSDVVAQQDGCEHSTNDVSPPFPPNAITVQLIPFNDTPNNGDEYKVWVTPVGNFLCSPDTYPPDDADNCPFKQGQNLWGFSPSTSKTDNFKVGGEPVEMDMRFFNRFGSIMDGPGIIHFDTFGASNRKYAYYAPQLQINHEAHVEAVEVGWHQIVLYDQPLCTIGTVKVGGKKIAKQGPQVVSVRVPANFKGDTIFVDVTCR